VTAPDATHLDVPLARVRELCDRAGLA
jgi:hypothetical protein